MMTLTRAALVVLALSLPWFGAASAQNAVTFGAIKADPSAPVEIAADQLAINQGDGTATFSGHVVIVQGAMRMGADEVRVEYGPEAAKPDGPRKIERLLATGNVTLTSGQDTAGADSATYAVGSGQVEMSGNVLLTQAGSTIAGQALTVDLRSGTGQMSGRVRTVLSPGGTAP